MMQCPLCGYAEYVKAGRYYVKTVKGLRQRYKCTVCDTFFSPQDNDYYKKILTPVRQQIWRLWHTPKLIVGERDKKSTYTVREIARMLNLSKSFVHRVITETRRKRR